MTTKWTQYAPLPLRLLIGFGMLYHGLPKFASAHEMTTGMFTMAGIPAPSLMVYVTGFFESLGGLMLLLGAFVPLAVLPLIVVMFVALFTVHLPNGFNFIHVTGMTPDGMPMFGLPGYEVNLLYIAGLAALGLMGAGALSVDATRQGRTVVTTMP